MLMPAIPIKDAIRDQRQRRVAGGKVACRLAGFHQLTSLAALDLDASFALRVRQNILSLRGQAGTVWRRPTFPFYRD
jgi:hypothetical protein